MAVFVGFVRSEAVKGHLRYNPWTFRHINCESLTLHMGSKEVPSYRQRMNFDNHQTQLALMETFRAFKCFGSIPAGLNTESFENGLSIFGFDISRDGNPEGDYRNADFEASSLSLEASFSIATTDSYTGKQNFYLYISKEQ